MLHSVASDMNDLTDELHELNDNLTGELRGLAKEAMWCVAAVWAGLVFGTWLAHLLS